MPMPFPLDRRCLKILPLIGLLSLGLSLPLAQSAQAQQDQPAQQAQPEPRVDLPITRAVLFSSGVGYFEHRGSVIGDAEMTLSFKEDQINDILKSMVLMDSGGGTISGVSYPAKEPLSKALQSFSVDLSGDPSLPELLRQLRGAQVTVFAPDQMTGSILNVAAQTIVEEDAKLTRHTVTLVTDNGIRTLPLESVSSLSLEDPTLQDELNKALALVAGNRAADRKPVTIKFSGQGERIVRIGYLVASPVWKTSYRLDLSPMAEDEPPMMQGWAILENTSDADWDGVNLSLVSGQPISFTMDLYKPLYVDRPEVPLQIAAAVAPQQYAEGLRREKQAQPQPEASRQRLGGRAMMESAGFAADAMAAQTAPEGEVDVAGSIQAAASGAEMGELFQYTIRHPVDLPRRRSAMIPIINQSIDAEKVSIYNQQVQKQHPLNGVMLSNDTGLKMLAGPVTVFDAGAYAGDARIGHLSPGDERLISYAVDLAVRVDASGSSSKNITSASLVNGVLRLQRKQTYQQTYTIDNSAEQARTLIVEHPFNNRRELVNPEQPMEKTESLYRFRVEVPAEATEDFTVDEQRIYQQSVQLLNSSTSSLQYYANTGQIDRQVRDALQVAINMKNELSKLENQKRQKQRELNEIDKEQNRIRQNLRTVGQNTSLGQRYVRKLSDQEDRIEKLRGEIDSLEKKITQQRHELKGYLNELSINP